MRRSLRGGTLSWETVSGRGGREVSYRKGMHHCLLAVSSYERRGPLPGSLPQILRVLENSSTIELPSGMEEQGRRRDLVVKNPGLL